MYTPPYAQMTGLSRQQALMRACNFAILVTPGKDGVHVTHLPLFLDAEEGEKGTLYGHMARANGHWLALTDGAESCAIFNGPHAYISPLWAGAPQTTVPTWNYAAVHSFGCAKLIEGKMEAEIALSRLTRAQEGDAGWTLDTLDAKEREKFLSAIISFKIEITRIEGKQKLSQNRTEAERAAIAGRLAETGEDEMARLMRAATDT